MHEEKILSLVSKLKLLDVEKLSMIEEAADNCLAVQSLERNSKGKKKLKDER